MNGVHGYIGDCRLHRPVLNRSAQLRTSPHLRDWQILQLSVACVEQILIMERPPPNPPITELGRPELKLAGAHSLLSADACACRPCACQPLPVPGQLEPILRSAGQDLKDLRPLALAGLRIDPEQASRSRMSYYTQLSLIEARRRVMQS